MHIKQVVIAITSCVIVGCATPNEGSEVAASDDSERRADCIFRSSIRGYSVLDDANLIVDGSGRRKYHVALSRRAQGLRSSRGIDFNSPTSRVCAGFSEVIFAGSFGNESVRIESIRELSPEEHEYLLIQYGKKEPEIKQTPVPREVEGAEVEELDPAAADESSGN